MTCGCDKPDKTDLWTPIPDSQAPTEILPGENIDCYAKRAGTNGKNDVAEQLKDRIENTSFSSDLNLGVNEQLKLTPGSQKVAARWEVTANGQPLSAVLPELTFNPATGSISGTVSEANANKNYEIVTKAFDSGGAEIDSRSFTFFPKKGGKEDTVKFVFPYSPNGRVTCKFGPRTPPAAGASSMHKGIDISQPGNVLGDILSSADGTVVKCGPARGFGNWIVIEHRDAKNTLVATTVYGHMNDIYVKVGQKVAAGQKIAKEGNAGIGSAAHLHFEIHKGSWGNPVDPLQYLNGEFPVAQNNLPGQQGQPDPGSFQPVNNSNKGITSSETSASSDCPDVLPNQSPPSDPATNPEPPAVPVKASTAEVQGTIQQALDEDPDLTGEDKKLLMFMAKIESNFKPDAKNPTSSARGLFQMLDKTAVKYYGVIGIPATEANRNNPLYATKAQIAFYKNEQKKYWNEYNSSGKSKIAGKSLSPAVSSRYTNYTQGEFIYGLIHHDGVGNAVAGKDLQGVDYYRKKIREA